MPETEKQREERHLRELEGKNISHYSVLLSAWIDTRMERDKTLVALSAAAIGLLITILTTVGVNNELNLVLIVISFFGFGLCIWSSLLIYQLNSKHIENELRNESDKNINLEAFDKRSLLSFVVGVTFLMFFGVSSAFTFLTEKENLMSGSKEKASYKPGKIQKHSLDGIGQLKPQPPSNQGGDSQGESSGSNQGSDKSTNNKNG